VFLLLSIMTTRKKRGGYGLYLDAAEQFLDCRIID
jgi:hypothetical protein